MGWFGRLLGTDKAVDNILDKDNGLLVRAGGWIDGRKYTEQEKAENDQVTREWGLSQLQALAPFKVVQRIIAFAVVGIWAFIAINLVIAVWVLAVFPEIDAKTALMELAVSDYVFWPVVSVLSLYMSGGVIPKMLGKGQSK